MARDGTRAVVVRVANFEITEDPVSHQVVLFAAATTSSRHRKIRP